MKGKNNAQHRATPNTINKSICMWQLFKTLGAVFINGNTHFFMVGLLFQAENEINISVI